jgi:ACS family tartrate transporter-like MFS transporter
MAIGTSRAVELADTVLINRTRHQTALRLLPFLFLLYITSYLDRTSVAYAAMGMSRDLGFSDRVFALGVGVFFLGYLALQVPGALLVERWSARRLISGTMIIWGSITVLTGLVHTPAQLYFARFFLGLAEASFFPGVVIYLSHWFIRKDRAKAASNFMAAVPLSLLLGSPIAGLIISHAWFGHSGWRWLFVAEGMPAILLGVVAFFWLTDWPQDAAWLSPPQRDWITAELEAEKPAARRTVTVLETLRSGRILMLAVAAFCAYLPSYAAIFWLPTLLKRQTGWPDLRIGIVLAIPYGTALLAMLFNGWHSDKYLERRWHTAIPALIATLGALGLIVLPKSTSTTIFLFSLVCIPIATLPTFWAIPTEILSDASAATAVGVVSSIANISGFVAPVLFGYLYTRTGTLSYGYAVMALCSLTSAILFVGTPGTRRPEMSDVPAH